MIRQCMPFLLFSIFLSSPTAADKNSAFQIICDIPYAENDNSRQTLDLFIPNTRRNQNNRTLPLVVWIHGGGWIQGDKNSGNHPARIPHLVKTEKYIGASINYRLSGEAKWPSQIHDCKAAIRWLRGNAEKYGINQEKIAVWGASAGGHLASMLGVSHNNKKLEGKLGSFKFVSSKVQAVINYYGPSLFLQMDDYPSKIVHSSPNSPESKLLGIPLRKDTKLANEASPYSYVNSDMPPFLHFHGTDDPLVPYNQSLILHQKLLSRGNKSSLITVQNAFHSMPTHFTRRWVIPFLDYYFYDTGSSPVCQTVIADRKKI